MKHTAHFKHARMRRELDVGNHRCLLRQNENHVHCTDVRTTTQLPQQWRTALQQLVWLTELCHMRREGRRIDLCQQCSTDDELLIARDERA
jgi:hypothetical protein